MKHNFKYNRKAFTLVELLIVIAIIGILFVVLVSKVDFATDKANATGVQTDFRSFQLAFETVSRENAGFNSLGWDTGDKADNALIAGYTYENADKDGGDRIRNSYDKGDLNLNGICEEGETWTGQKMYTETWTGIYTLDNPADATDMSAYLTLEKAINKNLDPALQISIDPENKTIYMANGYQDPWKTEYHGFYLTNANVDGMDRGAIVMYSDGPNKVFGSEQTIAKGKVAVTVKNGGINGQDDMALVTCYTYMNGYGEIGTTTFGFSNNQQMQVGGNGGPTATPSEPESNEITFTINSDWFDAVTYTVTQNTTWREWVSTLPYIEDVSNTLFYIYGDLVLDGLYGDLVVNNHYGNPVNPDEIILPENYIAEEPEPTEEPERTEITFVIQDYTITVEDGTTWDTWAPNFEEDGYFPFIIMQGYLASEIETFMYDENANKILATDVIKPGTYYMGLFNPPPDHTTNFKIAGTSYSCVTGMTWNEFRLSRPGANAIYFDSNNYMCDISRDTYVFDNNGNHIYAEDVIQPIEYTT